MHRDWGWLAAQRPRACSSATAGERQFLPVRELKKFIWIGLLALLFGGSAAIVRPILLDGRADYSRVVSIKVTREYQNPELLRQAWALPVAVLYQSSIEYQRNASVCGPTSIANVSHSLQRPGNQESILQGT